MIQRIQTLYLLIAAALMALTVFLPLGEMTANGEALRIGAFDLRAMNGEVLTTTLPLGILLAASAAVLFVTIFLFKRRLLQIRLCYAAFVLLIGAQAMMAYDFWKLRDMVQQVAARTTLIFSLPDVFPLVALILAWLAMRAIVRDEALVKSLDRIR